MKPRHSVTRNPLAHHSLEETLIPLGPEAERLREWSFKNVLPWMFERARGLWGRLLAKRLREAKDAQFDATVAAFPAQLAVQVQLICRPQGHHGLYVKDGRARAEFSVRIVVVAPFGVQPQSLDGRFAVLRGGDRVEIDGMKLTQGILGPGDCVEVEVARDAPFHAGNEPPAVGSVVAFYFGGRVTVLGPWSIQYGHVEFAEQVFMNVREG